jgi:hypothetical protein
MENTPPLAAGLLTVCLRSRNHALATFVQPRPFYSAFHIYVLTPKVSMTLQEKIWWATCIEHNRYRYNFGRQANRTLAQLVLPSEVPEWAKNFPVPEYGNESGKTEVALTPDSWTPLKIGSLFEVRRGRNILKRSMQAGKTPYVSAVANNNGVAAWLDQAPDHPAGCISVVSNGNGGMGYAFYQPRPFIASGDVTVLRPPRPLTAAEGLFVCTLITAERYRWNFGRKWTTTRVKESYIKLPQAADGSPDWELMRNFISSLRLASAVLSPDESKISTAYA